MLNDQALSRDPSCTFCKIVAGEEPAEFVFQWDDTVAFFPLKPVTRSHTLVVPKIHVRDFSASPEVTARTVQRASELMQWTNRDMNMITSRGYAATQSIFHLHIHLIPRTENDGLALPWHDGMHRKENSG